MRQHENPDIVLLVDRSDRRLSILAYCCVIGGVLVMLLLPYLVSFEQTAGLLILYLAGLCTIIAGFSIFTTQGRFLVNLSEGRLIQITGPAFFEIIDEWSVDDFDSVILTKTNRLVGGQKREIYVVSLRGIKRMIDLMVYLETEKAVETASLVSRVIGLPCNQNITLEKSGMDSRAILNKMDGKYEILK